MERSTDKILVTHTGSLPRPLGMLNLLKAKDENAAVDPAAFEAASEQATRDAVRKQIECGIDVVNDGEMSKITYSTYVKDRLSGFDAQSSGGAPPSDVVDFPEFARRFEGAYGGVASLRRPACGGPIGWKDRDAGRNDIRRFKAALQGLAPREAFMTAASPGVIALFLENRFYDGQEKYLEALAEVMKEEYEAIHAAGFVLQLDCPDLAASRHTRFARSSVAEFLDAIEMNIAAINRAVVNIPPDRIRLHLCWGNYEGPHHRDVPLHDILTPVFRAKVGAISFEAANPRHEHEWAIFETIKLPPDKIVIPGVIDSKTNFVEHPELVAQRTIRFARLVGRENVIAGTDCGFATFATRMPVDPEIAWTKLKSLAEGAAIASEALGYR